jgi:3-deoxy-D-manno-octulosonic-acid transferase
VTSAIAYGLYSLLVHALRLAAWPVLWALGRKAPAFRERWAERRGRAPLPAAARGGIVVHAVSMGEVAAATPLVEALLAARPDLPLTFTCTTPTASALIRERFGARVHHVYLPFDTPGAVRRFVRALAPRLLVLLELELWPNLLRCAQAQGAGVVLVNGRLSARSARRYARWRWIVRPALACVDRLFVQDADVRERFVALGTAPARVHVTGSLKFDTPLPPGSEALQATFRALTAGRRVWVAASTHDGEEAAALDALASLRRRWPELLLVLVPRHPQRFDAVATLLDARGLRWQRRSALAAGTRCAADTAVLLGDTMGELRAWFAVAEVAFVGGSLVDRGGHSPLEAMQFGVPLVSGPHVANVADVHAALRAADALRAVDTPAALGPALQALLADPGAARAIGRRGQAVFERQRGATQRSAVPILALLERLPPQRERADAGQGVRVDAERFTAPDAALLDASHWPQREPVGAGGRGAAWFVGDGRHAYVLRHYRRGGRVAVLGDRYLRRALPHTRAGAEFALLRRLRAWGVAVPRPCAARAVYHGLVARGDLLVERIDGARDLVQWLSQGPLDASAWRQVGVAIAHLHANGVDHRDLNARNVLIDGGGTVWLIDFDRCAVRAPGAWQAANLARLRRSLRKEAARAGRWHGDDAHDWPLLEAGYDDAMAGARQAGKPASP